MRNRGVEIYMLGPREKVNHDVIDLKSLLFNAGITRPARRDALLAIYNRMSQQMITADRLSVVDLLHSAFLTKQRSLRGFPAERSVRNACIDVYVKAKPTRDPRHREDLISLIDEMIEQLSSCDEKISLIDVDAATWSVRNLQDNLSLTLIRQQGLLLNAAVRMHRSCLSETDTKFMNVFCSLEEGDIQALNLDVKDVLSHLLSNFYEQSSRDDVMLRKNWISKMLQENGTLDKLEKESALMAREITSFRFRSANVTDSLPWDQWWLVGKVAEDENISNDANKLALLLYANSAILVEHDMTQTDMEKLKKENIMSMRQYCYLICNSKYW